MITISENLYDHHRNFFEDVSTVMTDFQTSFIFVAKQLTFKVEFFMRITADKQLTSEEFTPNQYRVQSIKNLKLLNNPYSDFDYTRKKLLDSSNLSSKFKELIQQRNISSTVSNKQVSKDKTVKTSTLVAKSQTATVVAKDQTATLVTKGQKKKAVTRTIELSQEETFPETFATMSSAAELNSLVPPPIVPTPEHVNVTDTPPKSFEGSVEGSVEETYLQQVPTPTAVATDTPPKSFEGSVEGSVEETYLQQVRTPTAVVPTPEGVCGTYTPGNVSGVAMTADERSKGILVLLRCYWLLYSYLFFCQPK
jgi:hypothetical protein